METAMTFEKERNLIFTRPKVLIVEDESIVAENIRVVLQSCGYEVIGVTESGRTALDIAKRMRPDVAIMDIHIKADLDGVETAVCLQGIFRNPIPVVFITAYPIENFPLLKALNHSSILKKPFLDSELTNS